MWLRFLLRLLLIPVVAGVSYEFIKLAGRSDNVIMNILSKPGMWIQRLTTKEPDEEMIQVAIISVESVLYGKPYVKAVNDAQGLGKKAKKKVAEEEKEAVQTQEIQKDDMVSIKEVEEEIIYEEVYEEVIYEEEATEEEIQEEAVSESDILEEKVQEDIVSEEKILGDNVPETDILEEKISEEVLEDVQEEIEEAIDMITGVEEVVEVSEVVTDETIVEEDVIKVVEEAIEIATDED